MDTDVQGVARTVAGLIGPDRDTGGYRWLVYQMADEIELCHALLDKHGIAPPNPAERRSTNMVVADSGELICR